MWVCRGYKNATLAAEDSLRLMQLSHIDLMLLHSPGDPSLRPETWRALEDLHDQVWTSATAIDLLMSSLQHTLSGHLSHKASMSCHAMLPVI